MKKLLLLLLGLFCLSAEAQFTPGQLLTSQALNAALASPTITGGTITGLSSPIPVASGGTGANTATGATSSLQYLQGGSGSVSRSVTSKLGDIINGRDFGMLCNGTADDGPALQNAINATSVNNPSIIQLPPGICRIATGVVLNNVAPIIRGYGYTEGPSPLMGTWLRLDVTGVTPFLIENANARGTVFEDLGVYEPQPPTSIGWTPIAYNYFFDIENTLGQVTFRNVLFAGITNGIKSYNSGRLDIESIYGQFYTNGVLIDDCQDIPRINYAHFWTYVTSDPNIVSYQESNLDDILLERVDGIFLGDIFGLAQRSVIHMTTSASGVTTKAYLSNLYADFTQYGVWIDSNNSTIQVANATTHSYQFGGSAAIAGSHGLYVTGNNNVLQLGNWRTDLVQSTPIEITGTGNVLHAQSVWGNNFNTLSNGSGLVDAASGNTVHVDATYTTNSNSAPLASTNQIAQTLTENVPVNAVNFPFAYASTTGNGVSLAPAGTDSSIDMNVGAIGTNGSVRLQANGGQTVFRVANNNSGNTDILASSGTGGISLIAESGSTNATINLNPKGSGVVALNGNSSVSGNINASGTGTMPLYSTTGAGISAPHKVTGTVTLSSGSATVTLSGNAVFTSSSSYVCTANDTTAANAVKVSQGSGTSIAFTGTSTDTVQFACAGS